MSNAFISGGETSRVEIEGEISSQPIRRVGTRLPRLTSIFSVDSLHLFFPQSRLPVELVKASSPIAAHQYVASIIRCGAYRGR
jgi:hypothetical protein